MRKIQFGILTGIFGFMAACSVNPVTERSQLSLVPENVVIARSYSSYANMMGRQLSSGKLNTNKEQTDRIRDIAFKIIPHAIDHKPEIINWKWEVNLIDEDEVNAFCMAGGKIAVYSGLIAKLQPTDDELAQVISHEIAHALSGHTQEKMSVALAGGLIGNAIIAASARRGTQLDADSIDALLKVVWGLPNSRQAETEADRIGIKLAAMGGYNPKASVTLWQKMTLQNRSARISLLSTHPNPEDREEDMRIESAKLENLYSKAVQQIKIGTQRKIEYNNGNPVGLYGKSKYEEPRSTTEALK